MYSETLQKQTKQYFQAFPMAMMKQFATDRFGAGQLERDGSYSVRVFNSDEVVTFKTIDALLDEGWVID